MDDFDAVDFIADFALGVLRAKRRSQPEKKVVKKTEPSGEEILELTFNPETGSWEYQITVRGGGPGKGEV